MTSITFDRDSGRWEVAGAPVARWAKADHLAADLVVYRDVDDAVVAIVVDTESSGSVRPEVISLVRDLAGVDAARQLAGDPLAPVTPAHRPVGSIGPLDAGGGAGLGFSIDPASAPRGVDGSRPGVVAWDPDAGSFSMTVPVHGDPGDHGSLWASVVDEATGDVLAAGRLVPGPGRTTATNLTIGVPFEAAGVRVRLSTGSPAAGSSAAAATPPGPVFYGAVAALVAVLAATVVAAAVVGAGSPGGTAVVIASGFEATAMVVEMLVAAWVVERLWRFRLLRPWVGVVVVASVFAYSNLMYSLANIFRAFDTWFSSSAQWLQQGSLLALPLAAGWALYRLAGRERT